MSNLSKKPIIRWTIGGNVSESGLQAQVESVRLVRKLYGDQFNLFICHNGLSSRGKRTIRKLNVTLVEQTEYADSLPPKPGKAGWVMYPPRLSLDTHEIFLDNDLILTDRLPQIDSFLKSDNKILVTQGCKRAYGPFGHMIPKRVKLNTGFMALPPGYDFAAKLRRTIKKARLRRWSGHHDSQGILVAALIKEKPEIIPISDIAISPLGRLIRGKCGIHFIKLNGTDKHKGWTQYRAEILKMI
tara:strand:+ start:3173 stop:3901 length:729 start_codon:yes stop_codon:yes gene_type:complete